MPTTVVSLPQPSCVCARCGPLPSRAGRSNEELNIEPLRALSTRTQCSLASEPPPTQRGEGRGSKTVSVREARRRADSTVLCTISARNSSRPRAMVTGVAAAIFPTSSSACQGGHRLSARCTPSRRSVGTTTGVCAGCGPDAPCRCVARCVHARAVVLGGLRWRRSARCIRDTKPKLLTRRCTASHRQRGGRRREHPRVLPA
jgi:hypothetical protein